MAGSGLLERLKIPKDCSSPYPWLSCASSTLVQSMVIRSARKTISARNPMRMGMLKGAKKPSRTKKRGATSKVAALRSPR